MFDRTVKDLIENVNKKRCFCLGITKQREDCQCKCGNCKRKQRCLNSNKVPYCEDCE